MTDRREWDRPAMVITLVLGLALVAGSIPFTVMAYCDQEGCEKEWTVQWSSLPAGSATARIDSTGMQARSEGRVDVDDLRIESVVLSLAPGDCDDNFDPQLGQQPASFRYTVARHPAAPAAETLAEGAFTCAEARAQGFTVRLDNSTHPSLFGHPDLALVDATGEDDARATAWAAVEGNETGAFVVTITALRPEPSLPIPPGLPVAGTRMQATLNLEVQHTALSVRLPGPEVLR